MGTRAPAGRSGVVAALVDPVLTARALVVGGLPPDAGDLDLLVDPADLPVVTAQLRDAGFTRGAAGWVRLVDGGTGPRADVAEVTTEPDWALRPGELATLTAPARPLPGYGHLVRPAPADTLVFLALRYGATRGVLTAAHRARIDAELAVDPAAFPAAERAALSRGCPVALMALQRRYETGRRPSAQLRYRLAREKQQRTADHRRLGRVRAARRALLARPAPGTVVAAPDVAAAERLRPLVVDLGREPVVLSVAGGPVWSALAVTAVRVRHARRRGQVALCAGYARDLVARGVPAAVTGRLLPAPDLLADDPGAATALCRLLADRG